MKRIIITDSGIEPGQTLDLIGEKYHYLSRVLRCRKGEKIMVGNGRGSFYFGELSYMDRDKVQVSVLEPVKIVWEDRVPTFLIQSMPKGNKIERIIRGATELGVSEVHPVISKRTLTRFDGNKIQDKNQRFKRIAQEAARQCGRPTLPVVGDILDFPEVVEQFAEKQDVLKIIFWEAEEKLGIHEALRESSSISSVVLAIGPEGGWAEDEVMLAKNAGFHSIKFGHGILRVETAAISFLSMIKFYLNMTEQTFS
ncbi:MAG: RsmE family RNA methyltransferase [Pseudomonadota bacterium]